MASSTMQRHADELRHTVAVFLDEPVSNSSVTWLTSRVLEVADRMSPPAATVSAPVRRLRAVRP